MSTPTTYSKEWFRLHVGSDPVHDDLDRTNCEKVGSTGHSQCGVCAKHEKPRFICGCVLEFPPGFR